MQPFLSRLLTVDLPGLMVLPKRLQINIPPAVTAVAEAAVGHDAVMRAVASAVLQVRFSFLLPPVRPCSQPSQEEIHRGPLQEVLQRTPELLAGRVSEKVSSKTGT